MVAKMVIKRTPTKVPKPSPKKQPPRHRRKSSSPLKGLSAASSAVASSLDRSLRSCRRRLLRVFARLAILGTPPSKLRKRGFRRLKTAPDSSPPRSSSPAAAQKPLPPPARPEAKTVFLDLDETLVHSTTDPPTTKYDFIVHPMIGGQVITFYVAKRPGVDRFLREISNSFEIVIYTAGLEEYASLVLDHLDPEGELISHRLYRDSCRETEGKFVKDLSRVGRDLSRVAIVDDNPNAYMLQTENAVPVSSFIDDRNDRELQRVARFFETALHFDDMRDAIASRLLESEYEKIEF